MLIIDCKSTGLVLRLLCCKLVKLVWPCVPPEFVLFSMIMNVMEISNRIESCDIADGVFIEAKMEGNARCESKARTE